jgi:hypothetical protein
MAIQGIGRHWTTKSPQNMNGKVAHLARRPFLKLQFAEHLCFLWKPLPFQFVSSDPGVTHLKRIA